MYRTNILSSFFAIAFGLILCFWIIPTQTPEYPGFGMPASLMPQILAIIIICCGAANLLKTLITKKGMDKPAKISLKTFGHCIGFLIVILALMPLMEWLGYFAGGMIGMVAFSILCGDRKPVRIAIVSVATVVIIWAGLWKGLSVMLP